MYKNTLITLALLLLVSGCAEKTDFTKGVSDKDKKLISSYDDKVLFVYDDIRITEHGFYPNFKILGIRNDNKSKYVTKVASYLDTKKFNLKIFIDDVNRYGLKKIKAKLLPIFKKFPDFKLEDKKALTMILSAKNSKIVNSYIEKKTKCIAIYENRWWERGLEDSWCNKHYYMSKEQQEQADATAYLDNFPSSSGSGGGYSSSSGYSGSSSSSSNSNYIPGRGYYRPGLGHGYSSQY